MRTVTNTANLKQNRIYYVKWILNQYRSHKKSIAIMLFLTFASTIIAVSFPIVLKYMVDGLIITLKSFQEGTSNLEMAEIERNKMLLVLLALGIGPFFGGFYPYYRCKVNQMFETHFRDKFFGEILDKGHRFFLKFRTGDLVTRLTKDIESWPPGLSWICCSGIFRAVNSACVIFFCFVIMIYFNPKLALLACIPLPIMAIIQIKLETSFSSVFKDLQEGVSETNNFLEAAYSGIKIISSFNAQRSQLNLFNSLMQKRIKQEVKVDTLWGSFIVFFEFVNYVGEIIVLIFGGIMVIKGELSIGTYYAFFSYMGMIIFPLMDIPMLFVSFCQTCVSIDRLEEIENTDKEWQSQENCGVKEIDKIEKISFDNVCFRHSGIEDLEHNTDKKSFSFENLNFELERGTKTAIVGQIGSGKTTLLNLISGVMKPDSGAVRINDISLSELNQRSFREKIGYIQQEPTIFSETIATNIDFWRNKHESIIFSCSRVAQFESEVHEFPMGYGEHVGQRGVTLSGGQRQRLSIARALVGNPQLLLMDDITASLDAANERLLWEDLTSKFGSLTCLIVTHRVATSMMADKIIVLKDGQIDSIGTHAELMKSSETYRRLSHT